MSRFSLYPSIELNHSFTTPPHEVFTTLPMENKTFSLFPNLPYDIRHMIWLNALSYERLIEIKLTGPSDHDHFKGPYRISLDGPRETNDPILNPLLLTCPESRKIAKNFYRVQLPCKYISRKDNLAFYPGVLYLCPELDIVHILGFKRFINFATDVYNNDRNRKGLLSLAIADRDRLRPQLPHFNKDATKAVVCRLQRVIFEGPIIGISRDKQSLEMPWSVPFRGSTTTFDRLPTDPRELDTVHVAVHYKTRSRLRRWRRFLAKAEIDDSQCQFETEVMLNLRDPSSNDKNKTDWENALKEIRDHSFPPPWPVPTPEYVPPVVAGFWMVPLKALQEARPDRPSYVDLREYPPELCVAHPSIRLEVGDFKGPVSECRI